MTTLQHTTPFRVDTSPPVVTGPVILGYDGETNKLTMNLSARYVGAVHEINQSMKCHYSNSFMTRESLNLFKLMRS